MNEERNEEDPCSIGLALETFGQRWKGPILWWLKLQPRRFGDLRKLVPGISAKVLTQHLRQLQHDGLIAHLHRQTQPPTSVYALTQLGRSLLPVLDRIADWWRAGGEEVEKARSKAAERDKPNRKDGISDARSPWHGDDDD